MSTTTRPRRSKPKAKPEPRRGPPRVTAQAKPYRAEVAVLEACASTCNATFAYCLTQGGAHVDEHHLKSLVDCVDLCQATASLVSRGSVRGEELMALCATACHDVVTSCAAFAGDEHMRECAAVASLAEDWCRH